MYGEWSLTFTGGDFVIIIKNGDLLTLEQLVVLNHDSLLYSLIQEGRR